MTVFVEQLTAWLGAHENASAWITLGLLLVAAVIADVVVRRILLRVLHVAVQKTTTKWDNAIAERGVFDRLSHIAPAVVIYFGLDYIGLHPELAELVQRLALVAIMIIVLRTVRAFTEAINDIYMVFPEAKARPIKGYLQIITLVVYLLGSIVIVATLLNKSPLGFLTGVGALSAVLLLVFKDTLLSLVASVQLTSNDMVRLGDWIEVPQHGADGDVVDIALHTVKVQNWDRTTTTVPTYALISQGFKNWRSMGESGGRRIRRAIHLETRSVRYLTDEEIDRFGKFELLREYIAEKRRELAAHNAQKARGDDTIAEYRRLTNIGTFRAYIQNYLAHRSDIRQDMIQMVRQRDPAPNGVPLEIYCFTSTTAWVEYEQIQSDIFDHLLALVEQFGLRVFQSPTGADFRQAFGGAPGTG